MTLSDDGAYFSPLNESECWTTSVEADRRSSSASELPLFSARVNRLPSAEIWFAMLLLRAGEEVPDDIIIILCGSADGQVIGGVDEENVKDFRLMSFYEERACTIYPWRLGFTPVV